MNARPIGTRIVAMLVVTLAAVYPGAVGVEAAEPDPRGVTRTTVTVSGVLGGDASSAGADVGAQARFTHENSRGGIAGRTVVYAGTEVDGGNAATSTAAVAKIATQSFALVPTVSSIVDVRPLGTMQLPAVGVPNSTAWFANPSTFSFTGTDLGPTPRTTTSTWGMLLRELLGESSGKRVAIVADVGSVGEVRAAQAAASVEAAGFTALTPVTTVTATTDLVAVASSFAGAKPDVVMLLTSPPTAAALAGRLGALGFLGTVATDALYDPANPAAASGVTVLTLVAPFEENTEANQQMAADVRAFKADQALTPAVAAGYWSADLFVAILKKVGRNLTHKRFLQVANRSRFHNEVVGTVGRSDWPAMHSRQVPCGALVQSDGTRYLLAEPFLCGRTIRVPAGRGG